MVVSLTSCLLWLTSAGVSADVPASARAELKAALAEPDEGKAFAQVEAIARRYPAWELPRLEAGELLLRRGDALDAAEWYLEAARIYAPENPRAHYLWAVLEEEHGRHAEAEQALRVALEIRNDYDDARLKLAAVLMTEGKAQEAVEAYRAVVAHQPEATGARLALASALEKAGQKQEAVKVLKAMLPGPAKLVAARKLSEIYRMDGKVKDAELVMKQVADPVPKRVLRPLKPSRR